MCFSRVILHQFLTRCGSVGFNKYIFYSFYFLFVIVERLLCKPMAQLGFLFFIAQHHGFVVKNGFFVFNNVTPYLLSKSFRISKSVEILVLNLKSQSK